MSAGLYSRRFDHEHLFTFLFKLDLLLNMYPNLVIKHFGFNKNICIQLIIFSTIVIVFNYEIYTLVNYQTFEILISHLTRS